MAKRRGAVSEYLAAIGRRGGQAKVKKGFATLTDEEKAAISKKAHAARQKKAGKKKVK